MTRGRDPERLFPNLGYGLGLRPPHYEEVLRGLGPQSPVSWFEVITENFMIPGGKPLHHLEKIRELFPVALHGVSLNLGSSDPLDQDYLNLLKTCIDRFDPVLVSDHCCWTGVSGQNLHDLLPVPYTQEALEHMGDVFWRFRTLLEEESSLKTCRAIFRFPVPR